MSNVTDAPAQYKPMSVEQLGLTETNQAKLLGAIEKYPLTFELLSSLVPDVPAVMVNGTPRDVNTYITMGDLIDSAANDTIKQRSIDPIRVQKVLMGDATTKLRGIVKMKEETNLDGSPISIELIRPITIGVDSEGNLHNDDGRHRTTALLTYAKLSGLDVSSPEFRAIKLRCVYDRHTVDKVIAANSCRRIRKSENLSVQLQKLGVNPDDLNSILAAVDRSNDPKSGIKLPMLFVAFYSLAMDTQEADGTLPPVLADLSPETIADIASQIPAKVSSTFPSYKYGLKNPEWVKLIMSRSYAQLPAAVTDARKLYSNIARAAGQIAYATTKKLEPQLGKKDGIPLIKAPEKKEKVAKEPKEAKVGKDKSSSDKGRVSRVQPEAQAAPAPAVAE